MLTKFRELLAKSLRDNKRLIIALYVIFIIVFVAAWALSGDRMQAILSGVQISNSPANLGAENPVDLFVHNSWSGILTYVASIFFAIPSIAVLLYNAVNLGVFGQMFSLMIPNGGIMYITYLIPHGIFEITATVLQSVCGILLFLFVWRFIMAMISSETHGVSDAFEKTKEVLIQSLILMIFSIILLLIAAPIEAYFSVPFSEFITGFLN